MNQASIARHAGARQAWALMFIQFLPILGIVAIAPILPVIIGHFRGMPNSETLVPLLLTVPGLCIALISPFAGGLIDTIGRRNLLLSSLLLFGFGGMLPILAGNFWVVMASRVLLGIAQAFIFTIGNVLIGDYFQPAERPKWLAIQGIVGAVLGTSAIMMSGQLAALGWQFPFYAYGLGLILFAWAWFVIFEPDRKALTNRVLETKSAGLKPSLLVLICSVTVVSGIIYFIYVVHSSLLYDALGVKDTVLLGRIGALASTGAPAGALLYKAIAKKTVLFQFLIATLLMGSGLTIIGLTTDYKIAVGAAWLQQVSAGMLTSILIAWSLSLLPAEHRGKGMGFWTSSFFTGQFLCPIVVSFVRNQMGGLLPAVAFFGILNLGISGAIFVLTILKNNKNESATYHQAGS